MALLGIDNSEGFSNIYKGWVESVLKRNKNFREDKWTQSIAVGGKNFVEIVKDKLGYKAIGRKVSVTDGDFELKENISSYRPDFQV